MHSRDEHGFEDKSEAGSSRRVMAPTLDTKGVAHWLTLSGTIQGAIREGEMVPDFELPNAHGVPVSIQRLLDRGPVAITFTLGARSPRCWDSLRALQSIHPQIQALGAELVAITPDPPSISLALAHAIDASYALLLDREQRLAGLFGIAYQPPMPMDEWLSLLGLDQTRDRTFARVPLPATYVVAPDGIATMAFVDPDPLARVNPLRILASLAVLAAVPKSGTP